MSERVICNSSSLGSHHCRLRPACRGVWKIDAALQSMRILIPQTGSATAAHIPSSVSASLKQIDEQSVSRLGLAWSTDFPTVRAYEATPLVKDGVMYTTGPWSVVYAMDARTGAPLWTYDPQVAKDHSKKFVCCDVVNRGVALYKADASIWARWTRRSSKLRSTPRPARWRGWSKRRPRMDRMPSPARRALPSAGFVLIGNAGSEYAVRGSSYPHTTQTPENWRGEPATPCRAIPRNPVNPARCAGPPAHGRVNGGRQAAVEARGTASSTIPISTWSTQVRETDLPEVRPDSWEKETIFTSPQSSHFARRYRRTGLALSNDAG